MVAVVAAVAGVIRVIRVPVAVDEDQVFHLFQKVRFGKNHRGDNHKFNNNSLTNKWALQTATEVV